MTRRRRRWEKVFFSFFYISVQLIVCVSLAVVISHFLRFCFYFLYFHITLSSQRLKLFIARRKNGQHSILLCTLERHTLISFERLTYSHFAPFPLLIPDAALYPHNTTISCRRNMNRSVCHRPAHTICWDRIRIVCLCICMFVVSLQKWRK